MRHHAETPATMIAYLVLADFRLSHPALALVVIMTPSHAFGALGREACSDRRSTCDRSRRAALLVLAGSSPRLAHSTTHRKIAGGASCHSPRRISYAASPFSFLRLDSCREQATKKTPDEEPAKKVHWGASSFARSATSVASNGCGERARLAETHRQSDNPSRKTQAHGVARSETFGC